MSDQAETMLRRQSLTQRLRGEYRIPICDGLGAVGAGEEPDNPNAFVRRFETPPIQHEAATEIERLTAEVERLKSENGRLRESMTAAASTTLAPKPTWDCPSCGTTQHNATPRHSSSTRFGTLYGVCKKCADSHTAFDATLSASG